MKKTAKKLVLAKETVKNLEEPKLNMIAGGTSGADSCHPYYCPRMPIDTRAC